MHASEERRQAEAISQLLKLILVSAYGVTVRIHGLARSLAESIMAYGRYSLQTTWEMAKEGGLHPVYGDTDSLFLDNPDESQVEWHLIGAFSLSFCIYKLSLKLSWSSPSQTLLCAQNLKVK
jgi:DNA polymerase elongation subunit (family B)